MTEECTYEEFKNFFYAKAFDVIGNGTFRKHLAKCRDAGDPWAVKMSLHVQAVQGHIKAIHSTVHSMPQTSNNMHEICKDVMVGAQPPTRLHAGCVRCSVTKRQCMKCLDLTRNHKGSQSLFIDARFSLFFMLLWYCNKIEYIIRSYTRTWLDSRSDQETYEAQCRAIQSEMEGVQQSMYNLFTSGKRHITETLKKYEKSYQLTI